MLEGILLYGKKAAVWAKPLAYPAERAVNAISDIINNHKIPRNLFCLSGMALGFVAGGPVTYFVPGVNTEVIGIVDAVLSFVGNDTAITVLAVILGAYLGAGVGYKLTKELYRGYAKARYGDTYTGVVYTQEMLQDFVQKNAHYFDLEPNEVEPIYPLVERPLMLSYDALKDIAKRLENCINPEDDDDADIELGPLETVSGEPLGEKKVKEHIEAVKNVLQQMFKELRETKNEYHRKLSTSPKYQDLKRQIKAVELEIDKTRSLWALLCHYAEINALATHREQVYLGRLEDATAYAERKSQYRRHQPIQQDEEAPAEDGPLDLPEGARHATEASGGRTTQDTVAARVEAQIRTEPRTPPPINQELLQRLSAQPLNQAMLAAFQSNRGLGRYHENIPSVSDDSRPTLSHADIRKLESTLRRKLEREQHIKKKCEGIFKDLESLTTCPRKKPKKRRGG